MTHCPWRRVIQIRNSMAKEAAEWCAFLVVKYRHHVVQQHFGMTKKGVLAQGAF